MNDSTIKYFDFSQALKYLKDGLEVTNTNYNPYFRIKLENNKFILTNFTKVYLDSNTKEVTYIAMNGDLAVIYEMESFSIDDILCETWYLYY